MKRKRVYVIWQSYCGEVDLLGDYVFESQEDAERIAGYLVERGKRTGRRYTDYWVGSNTFKVESRATLREMREKSPWGGRVREERVRVTYTFSDGSEWFVENDALHDLVVNEETDALTMNMSHGDVTKRYRDVKWEEKP